MASEIKTHWKYPGKVLIVDDQYYENEAERKGVICDAVNSLVRAGVPVEYWNGKDDRPFSNIRIIILDLLLDQSKKEESEYEYDYYDDAIDALKKIPGRPLVIVFSSSYTKDKLKLLEEAYKARTGTPFGGIFVREGMTKGDLDDKGNLNALIEKAIEEDDMIQLFLHWESVLDGAKDKTIEEMLGREKVVTIETLIKLLHKESGKDSSSLGREFMTTVLRILSRFTNQGKSLEPMRTKLMEIAEKLDHQGAADMVAGGVPEGWSLHSEPLSFIMYYHSEGEKMWTGEIYKMPDSPVRQYAIVLTPACDFAQGKLERVTICYGFRIGNRELEDTSHPIYQKDKSLNQAVEKARNAQPPAESTQRLEKVKKDAIERYLRETDSSIPDRFYRLANFFIGEQEEANHSMLCFDFQDIESVSEFTLEEGKIRDWTRIMRLDSPFVDLMMREFGAYLSRFGVLGINSPIDFKLRTGVAAAPAVAFPNQPTQAGGAPPQSGEGEGTSVPR